MKLINAVGMRFGKLEVLKKTNLRYKNGSVIWECKCDCGNVVQLPWHNIKRSTSCGCANKRAKQDLSKDNKNTFETLGSTSYMYDHRGNITLIDTDDIPRLSSHYWRKNPNGYWVHANTLLHRFITQCPKGLVVDHINHTKSDNRKSNLRICTPQENQINKKPKDREIPTGIYKTPYGKYRATLRLKQVKLFKNFETLEEAITQRKEWEDLYLGNFKYQDSKRKIKKG